MESLVNAAQRVAELAPTTANRAMFKLLEARIEMEKEMLTTCDLEQVPMHRHSIKTMRELQAVINGRPEVVI